MMALHYHTFSRGQDQSKRVRRDSRKGASCRGTNWSRRQRCVISKVRHIVGRQGLTLSCKLDPRPNYGGWAR